MKVLHVIPSLSHVHGGPTRALALMEGALAEQGVTVETATTDDDGPGRHNGKACGQPLQENGAVHWYFSKALEFYKPSPAFARWIARNVHHYDLVHIHALFSFTTPAAAWAARRAGVPYVVRPLGTLNGYGMNRRRPWLKALSMRFVEGPLLRQAAAVHFTSEEEAAEARQLGIAMREAIIPLGVETGAAVSPGPNGSRFAGLGGSPCALFLSRLDAKKNVEGLLDAVTLLKDEMPGLRLLVAGDGLPDYVASLKARAQSLGISGRVTWAGHVEGAAKADAFAAADVFVLPSFSENFGIAAAEALAAGLPCLLGEGVAIARDVVAAGAGAAVSTDPQSVADGLRRIMASNEGLVVMSANARRLAQERFSTQAMGASLKHLYTGILNGANGFSGSR
jgi:glycosyltransferase involved in cell wall biosynthesis